MKTALVLEGGGMRGAYTAGCLAWLIENNVHFDSAYGISTGAVHLCSNLSENIDYLYDLSTNHIADKELIGLRPLLREGHYVGYDYLFEHILPVIKHYDISKAINSKTDAKIGVYDLELGKTVYLNLKEMDDKLLKLKGSCTLPISWPARATFPPTRRSGAGAAISSGSCGAAATPPSLAGITSPPLNGP